ncbi:MAG TPA: TetR/AcrR family transcriptional regulator [Coxiellaceae bacterium]|nr:TetR/AcrR family transcriptional regulator [Coxiellaceae bacterium]
MKEAVIDRTVVTRQPSMRSRLLLAAAQLFVKKGYSGASLSEIAAVCNIKKSSLFHHFVSKEAIALETIGMVKKYCDENIFQAVYAKDLSLEERKAKFLENSRHFFCERTDNNALVGFLGIALVDVADAFNVPVKQYFDAWQSAIVRLLEAQMSNEQAQTLATALVSQLQGSLLMWRVYQDPRYIDEAYQQLVRAVNQAK